MKVFQFVKNLYKAEPARFVAVVVAAVIGVASVFGVVVDKQDVVQIVVLVVAVLFGGEATRKRVSPVK